MKRTILKGIGAAAVAGAAIGLFAPVMAQERGGFGQQPGQEQEQKLKIGQKAPTFTLTEVETGQRWNLQDYIGKHEALVINFVTPKDLKQSLEQSGMQQQQQQKDQQQQQQQQGRFGQGMGGQQGMSGQDTEISYKAINEAYEDCKDKKEVKFISVLVPEHALQQTGQLGQSGRQGQMGQQGQQGQMSGDQLSQEAKEIARQVEYQLLLDRDGTIAKQFGVSEAPHSVVLDQQGTIVFAAAGERLIEKERRTNEIKTNFLEEAIQSVLDGKRVEHPYGASTVPASAPRQGQSGSDPWGGRSGGEDY